MSVREEIHHLVQELSEDDLKVMARMLRGPYAPAADRALDAEARA